MDEMEMWERETTHLCLPIDCMGKKLRRKKMDLFIQLIVTIFNNVNHILVKYQRISSFLLGYNKAVYNLKYKMWSILIYDIINDSVC